MEHEAKFQIRGRIKARQIEDLPWGAYALGPRTTHDLRDTLLDTQERTLSSQKYGLRIRHDGDQILLTLKAPGKVSGAVHSRKEIEEPISAVQRDDPALWPATITKPLEKLIGGAPLAPLLTIRNRRRTWMLLRDGAEVAELALDRGEISAGERSLAMHELEIELKGDGSADDIEAIATFLRDHLALEPQPLSKLQRGVMLLEQREHTPQLKQAAFATLMAPDANFAEAGRSILARHALKLHQALPVARIGTDSEGVHQARVACRRLRATLAALGEAVYDEAEVAKLRKGLKRLASSLGAVRDADVFLEKLPTGNSEIGDLALLRNAIEAQRAEDRAALIAALDHKRTGKLLNALDAFVLTPGAGVVEDSSPAPRTLVRHWAGSLLWGHYERLRAYEPLLAAAEPATFHEMRIDVKHLRYLIELFMDAMAAEAESLHEQLVAMQDHLGDLQDAEVAIERVNALIAANPDDTGLLAYRLDRQSVHDTLYAQAPKAVAPLFGLPFRKRLGALIARL